MAAKITDAGLQRIGAQASESTGGGKSYDAARNIQVMSVDDSTVAIAAGDTAANSGGAITNFFDKVFDSTPTLATQTVTHVTTFASGEANFTIRRILLHDDTTGNVTASSTTNCGGVDGQAFTKTSDFSVAITLTITYADAS